MSLHYCVFVDNTAWSAGNFAVSLVASLSDAALYYITFGKEYVPLPYH